MGLRTRDVDVATGVIWVEQAYDPRSKEVIPPKSYAGRRKVPIAGLIRDTLIDARARAFDPNLELVFGRDDGRPFSYNGILDRAKRIWNFHGLDPIGLHECRHTFASLMIAAMSDAGRLNSKVLQTLMGHASISETPVRATGETARRGKSAGKTLWRCGKVSSVGAGCIPALAADEHRQLLAGRHRQVPVASPPRPPGLGMAEPPYAPRTATTARSSSRLSTPRTIVPAGRSGAGACGPAPICLP
jgi:Phage integrase family